MNREASRDGWAALVAARDELVAARRALVTANDAAHLAWFGLSRDERVAFADSVSQ